MSSEQASGSARNEVRKAQQQGICFACRQPGAEMRGIDGELYHGECHRQIWR